MLAFFVGYIFVFCAFYGAATAIFAAVYAHLGALQWAFTGWKLLDAAGIDPVAATWVAMPVAALVSASYGWRAYQRTLQ